MKKITHLIITPLILIAAQNAAAVVLNFEEVPDGGSTQNSFGVMPTYQGFDFTSESSTLHWIDVVDSSWDYGAVSGDFALTNNFSGAGVIIEASSVDFTFDGLYAKKWGTDPDSGGEDSLFGTLSGYKDGDLVWEMATGLNGSYEYYGAQAGLIDQLRLDFGNNFLVDDIVLNAAVPVPAAAWLFASGLIGLIGVARRNT